MFQLDKVHIRNFLSYGNNVTTINLDFNKPVLVLGRNLDATVDGQIDANGAGKSTIMEAILFGCYGKTISEKPIDELINNINNKNMEVAIEGRKDGVFYKIEKVRKNAAKGGNQVYLMKKNSAEEEWVSPYEERKASKKKDAEQDITNDSVGNVDAEIEKLLGMPFEMFSRIIIIAASHTPFLDLGLATQREIIEELCGFTEVSEKAEKLKKIIKDNTADLNALIKLNDQIKLEIDRYTLQLTSAKNKVTEWNNDRAIKLKELKQKIKDHDATYGSIDFDAEEVTINEIEKLTHEINSLQRSKTEQDHKLSTAKAKITDSQRWDRNHEKELDDLAYKLNQPLIFKTLEEAEEFEAAVKVLSETETNANQFVNTANQLITSLQRDIKSNTATQESTKKLIEKYNKDITNFGHELVHLNDSKCPYCSQTYILSKDKIASVTASLNNLEKEVKIKQDELEELEQKLLDLNNSLTETEVTLPELKKELQDATNKKNQFINDKLGSSTTDFRKELQKTKDYQKLVNEFAVKEKQKNPYLANTTMEALEADVQGHEIIINQMVADLTQLNNTKDNLTKTLKLKTIKDITTVKLKLETMFRDYETLKEAVNPHADTLTNLENNPPSELKTDKIQELHDLLEHQEFLLKLLTKKDSFIRKALVNRYVPLLNSRIKYYLEKIGLPHKVEFQQDMSIKITQFKSQFSFKGLSAGQKARVNLALSFAFRDVLQSRYGKVNLCILDECLDTSLSNVGVQMAAKMIKAVAKENKLSMFVISHRDEISPMFDSKLVVELKNGFSNIVHSDI